MAEFLSLEWLHELDRAASSSRELTELGRETPLVVEQRVNGTPYGDVTYHFIIDDQGARVVVGSAPAPDVTLTTDFTTACAMHRGDTNAQQGLNNGIFKIGGTVGQLLRRREAFAALVDVFTSVRDSTTGTSGTPR